VKVTTEADLFMAADVVNLALSNSNMCSSDKYEIFMVGQFIKRGESDPSYP
jgi:hypothetical protein